MGLFEKLFPKKTTYIKNEGYWQELNAQSPIFIPWSGKIFESSTIRACISAKAQAISKLQVDIHGTANPKTRSALKHQPNPYETWDQFLSKVSTILDVYNTALIVPILNDYGETTGIYSVLPQNCSIVSVNGQPYLKYQFGSGKQASIEMSKAGILTKHKLYDDVFGENNYTSLKSTCELIDLQNQALKEGIKNSSSFRFLARLNSFTLPEDLARERADFSEKNLSKGNGGLLLFPNTMDDIKQIESKPFVVDAETQNRIEQDCFDYFNVNRAIIQNSATTEQMNSFYEGCISPFAIQLSSVLTKMLFSKVEQSTGNRVVVSQNRLMYLSVADKVSLVTNLADRGCISIGEIRTIFDLPLLDNDEINNTILCRGEYYNVQTGEKSQIVDTPIEGDEKNDS